MVGVVVVHGIGEQEPGDTLAGALAGLRRGFPRMPPAKEDEGCLLLDLGDRRLRFYEGYWASELSGAATRGSFDWDLIPMLARFPQLNLEREVYPGAIASPEVVRQWTRRLRWLTTPLWMVYSGARLLLPFLALPKIFARRIREPRRRLAPTADKPEGPGGFIAQARERAEAGREEVEILDVTLDQTAGDVVNYVKSRAGAHVEGSPFLGVAERIGGIVAETLRRALEECDEVHLLTHSLGTVIAYDVLCGSTLSEGSPATAASPGQLRGRIRALYTLGSPLEKILFFWPRLVGSQAASLRRGSAGFARFLADDFEWHNFHHRNDLVAGELLHFDGWAKVQNHPLDEVGGVLSSHVSYFRDPTVQSALGDSILGLGEPAPRSRAKRILGPLGKLGERALAGLVAAASLIAGAALLLLVCGLVPLGLHKLLVWVGLEPATADWVALPLMVAQFLATLFGIDRGGLTKAKNQHPRFIDSAAS